jgi:hypothetical protein
VEKGKLNESIGMADDVYPIPIVIPLSHTLPLHSTRRRERKSTKLTTVSKNSLDSIPNVWGLKVDFLFHCFHKRLSPPMPKLI